LLIPFFLCWGSFLNVLAYRLVHHHNFTHRSQCPHCTSVIAWYDNIPIISWFALRGKCRQCKQPISPLYPSIELFTTLALSLLFLYVPHHYFFAYFVFFSGLIVTIRSDIETMLISRFVTLLLVPFGVAFSFFGLLPITFLVSAASAFGGYAFLYIIAKLFFLVKGKQGIGQGDFDLLALIGAFIGPIGLWATILIGSIAGSIFGITYVVITGTSSTTTRIPFGPFLALGAMSFVLFQDIFLALVIRG